ncbi:MAG TPA: hypothetical protein VFY83_09140 [Anaerolineales bacterium]|nr:hypothetical protein [Anaerolineales bacterium]
MPYTSQRLESKISARRAYSRRKFIASAPVLIFYAIFQRKIIAGITTTGMAGQ